MSSENQLYAAKMRKKLFAAIYHAGGGHFGGTLSIMEILAVLYNDTMRIDPQNPNWKKRDRMVLAKGHAGPALYVILADKAFFPEEWMNTLDTGGGHLPKHVDRLKVPGIDYSSGSLGQGLSVAAGMAAASKMDELSSDIYVILGDGECDEGQIWEAALLASKYELDNLIVFLDRNHCQIDGYTDEVLPLEPLKRKWEDFGWNVLEINGHDTDQIERAVAKAKENRGKPTIIIAETVKGKGVSFMENQYLWHSGSITKEQFQQGMKDLEEEYCGKKLL